MEPSEESIDIFLNNVEIPQIMHDHRQVFEQKNNLARNWRCY